jgi:hypothetical protein
LEISTACCILRITMRAIENPLPLFDCRPWRLEDSAGNSIKRPRFRTLIVFVPTDSILQRNYFFFAWSIKTSATHPRAISVKKRVGGRSPATMLGLGGMPLRKETR